MLNQPDIVRVRRCLASENCSLFGALLFLIRLLGTLGRFGGNIFASDAIVQNNIQRRFARPIRNCHFGISHFDNPFRIDQKHSGSCVDAKYTCDAVLSPGMNVIAF